MNNFFDLTEQRKGWVIFSSSFFAIFFTALFFQHAMQLNPCVMCIEERMLILLAGMVSLIPIINPRLLPLRLVGYIGVIAISYIGFELAAEHALIQRGEGEFMSSCSLYPRVPVWLPLHEWMPSIFMPTGDCGSISWEFAGQTMVEWVRNIFAIYIAIPLLMIIGRIVLKNKT